MLIDHTYFVRDLFIAQRSQLEVREEIDLYIKVKEPEFLKKILGEETYQEYMGAMALPEPDRDPVWDSLTEILVDQDLFVSPIANYVYVSLMEDSITKTTGIGELLPKGENGDKVNPTTKITWAWNSMVDMVCKNHSAIKALDLPDYAYQDRTSICRDRDAWSACGCKENRVFSYRNRFGL